MIALQHHGCRKVHDATSNTLIKLAGILTATEFHVNQGSCVIFRYSQNALNTLQDSGNIANDIKVSKGGHVIDIVNTIVCCNPEM